ncbi:hypothetical protein BP6252_03370 [Coleophoma cylindrospora]|uniref:Uncharacterized protein n=1 Tax=Coleophoma cylindrospora TaxID=1849047 RepID=A0A3D8S900_9HELO|nr:hypothetical protein BP6252_03370 [Coleophoma cylindrospora]
MGKGTPKRKLDQTEPSSKAKRTSTTEKHAVVSEASEEDHTDEIFMKARAVAPARMTTARSTKKSESQRRHSTPPRDEAEDEGDRVEEENYIELFTMLERMKTKRKTESIDYINKFESNVSTSQQSLKDKLGSLRNHWKMEDMKFVDNFQRAFEAATGTRCQGLSEADPIRSDFSSNIDQSNDLLTTAEEIITVFKHLDNDSSKRIMGRGFLEDWEEEDKLMKTVVDGGQEFAMQKTNSILLASRMPAMEPNTTKAAQALFEDLNTDSAGWGKLVKKQVKLYKKIDKLKIFTG